MAERVRKQLDELRRAHHERSRAEKEHCLAELEELIRLECRRADADYRLAGSKRRDEEDCDGREMFVGLHKTTVVRKRFCEGCFRQKRQSSLILPGQFNGTASKARTDGFRKLLFTCDDRPLWSRSSCFEVGDSK